MSRSIDEALGAFAEDDYTVRLCRTVFRVVPFAPDLPFYSSLSACLKQIEPNAHPKVLEKAQELARGEDAQRALWMFDALDTADSGITVYTGVKSAVALYKSEKGSRLDAFETDPQQAADAALKGLAMAYAVYRLFPGGPVDKVKAFRDLQTGQALAFYYAALDVGLPFADNAISGGGNFLHGLYEKLGDDQTAKLASIAGDEAAEGAKGVMSKLMDPLEGLVSTTSEYLGPIADAAADFAPRAMAVGDKVAGGLATAADVMPVYRFLGARLVAEHCVRQALKEISETVVEAEKENPALVPIKYTQAAPEEPPKGRGCFLWPFAILVTALGAAASQVV
jgi:hypothetical protein